MDYLTKYLEHNAALGNECRVTFIVAQLSEVASLRCPRFYLLALLTKPLNA